MSEGYGQYCPLAKGAEVFAERWTPLILRELLRGSTTFNDLHRGVPRMSRSLLSSRLRKLESCGVVKRSQHANLTEYHLTPAGRELGAVVSQLGTWAQRWFRSTFKEHELDVGVLMWDMRCTVDAGALPSVRTVVQFTFTDQSVSSRYWWLLNDEGGVDLCPVDPGEEATLEVRTTLRVMTRVWMGDLPIDAALSSGQLKVYGSGQLKPCLLKWLRLSPYAPVRAARRTPPSQSTPRETRVATTRAQVNSSTTSVR
jgi:DNA-binding HxlR family transcriptional regulator